MKQLTILGLFFLFAIGCFCQNELIKIHPQAKSDSLEVLAGYDFFVLGYEPGDPLGERITTLTFMINRGYKFEELEQLLHHKNIYINLYAFLAMCENYFVKITDAHLKITKSGKPLTMYDPNGNMKYKTVGFWAKEMYTATQETNTQDALYRPPLEVAIKSFILKYASYPDSYNPVSFSLFIYNDSHLKIYHTYIIKNNFAITDTIQEWFVTDPNHNIQEISEENTGTISTTFAKINDWLSNCGRAINKQDSLELRLEY